MILISCNQEQVDVLSEIRACASSTRSSSSIPIPMDLVVSLSPFPPPACLPPPAPPSFSLSLPHCARAYVLTYMSTLKCIM